MAQHGRSGRHRSAAARAVRGQAPGAGGGPAAHRKPTTGAPAAAPPRPSLAATPASVPATGRVRRGPRPLSQVPEPESRLRRLWLHAVALGAVLATAVYLVWRIGWTMPSGAALWIGVPF